MRRLLIVLFITLHGFVVAGEVNYNIDYTDESAWLCLPGRDDACAADLTTTVIDADGSFTRETWHANPDAQVDCLYVYPTVAPGPELQSGIEQTEAEIDVVQRQFARFASQCRPFAPMYRQFTISALRTGEADALGLGFDDVLNAWRHYLAHHNDDRGFVLVGHSQGAAVLAELIRREIDGRAIQSRMVGALLIGATVPVGAFEHVPACRSAAQTGCVISYGTFLSDAPPPADTMFGRVDGPDQQAICTNPAALEGNVGALRAYFPTDRRPIFGAMEIPGVEPPGPWVVPERAIDTPWVSVPGLLTARCVTNEYATFLEVTVHGDPGDARTDHVTGAVPGCPQCGLHLVDMDLAMGNLIEIVERQTRVWLHTSPCDPWRDRP